MLVVHTHTHPAGPVLGKSCDVHDLKQQETREVSMCQKATVLREFIVSYFKNATLFHSNQGFFFLKTVTCYSLIFCSYFVLIKMLPTIPYFVLFRVNRLCNLLLATKLQYQKKEIILHPLKTGLRRQKRVLSILPLQMSACVCEELEILLAITWLSAG